MSFRGLGTSMTDLFTPRVLPGMFDYLSNGPGRAELERVGVETVRALIGQQGGNVNYILSSPSDVGTKLYVARNTSISAIWDIPTASLFASFIVGTVVYEQKMLAQNKRTPVYSLVGPLMSRITTRLLNGGDPAGCMQTFQQSFAAWKELPPIRKTPSAWCKRLLVLDNSSCELVSVCDRTADGTAIYVPAPPAGTVTEPSVTSVTVAAPAPTHAEIESSFTKSDPNSVIQQQELAEFGAYLSALSQARGVLTMGLGLPASAPDADVWNALSSRGIAPPMAIDWFVGCDADLNCFRQRMNQALGGSEERGRDMSVKFFVGVAALGAVAYAAHTMRGRR